MDGNIWLRRNLVSWLLRRLATMGLCCWANQSTGVAFFRVLPSPVGADPGKLLVHVFLGSRRVELLDKVQDGVKAKLAKPKHYKGFS